MLTFIICLTLLILSYFTYGKYVEKLFGIDPTQKMPSETHFDGVDYVPMKKWKTFLIQLLNIAGLGPIFGAVLGATYGTVAFVWITLGGIFIGAVHDFALGYISVKYNGLSYPEIVSRLLGTKMKYFINLFIVFLMVLVGAVFMVGPAGILNGLTGVSSHTWLFIILIYYFFATMLPIDKIIGKIYPIFGAALLFMAMGLLVVIFSGDYTIPELSFTNMKTNAAAFPIVPTLFITIACGAISGFHATQSPLTARCMTNQKQCKPVFFGAMISESIIALIWAAIAMAFFGGVSQLNTVLTEHGNDAAWVVDKITNTTLGRIGGILALLGVVAAPVSTGDTAFRSARLIVADFFNISQQKIMKRLWISIPLFVAGYVITLLDFGVLWRYFAWMNQALSVAALWAATIFLAQTKKNYFITMLPAMFMTYIVSDYMFSSPQMIGLQPLIGTVAAATLTLLLTGYFIYIIKKWRRQ
jgi:carbon starvation protein CstA